MSPQRVQLKRTKGWHKPENTVVVARPTKWGNPFRDEQKQYGVELAVALYADMAHGCWNPTTSAPVFRTERTYWAHQGWLKRIGRHPLEAIRSELAGKNLACWCPLDKPCHADVLLKLANPGEDTTVLLDAQEGPLDE